MVRGTRDNHAGQARHAGKTMTNPSEYVCCTPELRHAGRRLIRGHLGRFCLFLYMSKQSPGRGSVEIPKGFPRPVGAVGNRSLVSTAPISAVTSASLAGLLEFFRC